MSEGFDTSIFIPTRDRVAGLRQLVTWLEKAGYTRLVLVDSASGYEPMLEYLAGTPHQVVRLAENLGSMSPWLSGAVAECADGKRYVVADPDVVPDEGSPPGAVAFLSDVLDRYPIYVKAGLGLKIDDLPTTYEHAALTRAFESQYWRRRIRRKLYQAPVGTTFAVYQPGRVWPTTRPAIRTGPPYVARRLAWYADSAHPTAEDIYCRTRERLGDRLWSAEEEVAQYLVVPPVPNVLERARWRLWVMLKNRERRSGTH